jgi:hypothetical protein
VVLIRTDVSEERIASIIMVNRIRGLETLAVTNNWNTNMRATEAHCEGLLVSDNVPSSLMVPANVCSRKQEVEEGDGKRILRESKG